MTLRCESCGMPVESGRYCAHCVDETGEWPGRCGATRASPTPRRSGRPLPRRPLPICRACRLGVIAERDRRACAGALANGSERALWFGASLKFCREFVVACSMNSDEVPLDLVAVHLRTDLVCDAPAPQLIRRRMKLQRSSVV